MTGKEAATWRRAQHATALVVHNATIGDLLVLDRLAQELEMELFQVNHDGKLSGVPLEVE